MKKCRWLLSPWRRWKKANTESYQQAWLPKFIVLLWAHSPECLLDSTNPQVNDLQQIITGTGQKLCSLRVQVQSCDPPKQLQFFYYAFSPRKRWGDSRGKKKKKRLSKAGCGSQTTASKLVLVPVWKRRRQRILGLFSHFESSPSKIPLGGKRNQPTVRHYLTPNPILWKTK